MRTQKEVNEGRAIELLTRIATDAKERAATRVAACQALSTYMPQMEVVNALSEILSRESETSEVRLAAILALGRTRPNTV